MVSDQDIARGVETLLRQSDPNSMTTLNAVVEQLGAMLGLDLSHKAGFIRDQINLILRSHPPPPPPPPPLPPKDLFPFQHYPQFHNTHPQFHPHFAYQQLQQYHQLQLHQHQHHPHPLEELVFTPQPQPPPTQPRRQPLPPPLKLESDVQSSQPPKVCAPVKAKRKGGPGGLTKICGVSPELQAVVGEPLLPRTEIVKQLWAYIRKNKLQDPSNKRKIICDDALRVVFETDSTDMFKMNKLLAKHIIRLEPKEEASEAKKRLKVEADSATESRKLVEDDHHRHTGCAVIISEALANFFGSEEREMMQSEVFTRVWEYIKVNRLEDSLNSMAIMCDAKLKELFGCDRISALGISEMLARHHLYNR